jgi:hypothetical protein
MKRKKMKNEGKSKKRETGIFPEGKGILTCTLLI